MLGTQRLRMGRRPQRFTKSMLTVLSALIDKESMTSHELSEQLSLPKRTVIYALRRLVKEGIVKSCPSLLDARSMLYAAHIEGLDPIVRDNLVLRIKEART